MRFTPPRVGACQASGGGGQSESAWIAVEASTNRGAKDERHAGRSRESVSQVSSRLISSYC